ncbi:LacI family DNA-binding transcriptional regulator [bacterium]|nr:LacI family DNA-binding transcriptional regulator [bacterium]
MALINQSTIAKTLNVSRATVSKALKDADDISAEMKKRVWDLAEKLNYIPHYHAKRLHSQKTNLIGVVVPDISNSFFSFVIDGIMDIAGQSDYHIILTVSREKADTEEENILTLLSMRVDGILLAVSEETRDTRIFEKIKQSTVPLVYFDRAIEGFNFTAIGIDDRDAARKLIDFVVRCGYRHIGHLGGSMLTDIGRNRRDGYIDALKHHHIPVRDAWVVEGGFTRADGYRSFMRMQQNGPLPEVIFAANDQNALGAYDAMKELGISFPETIGIVAFGHHEFNRIITPSLTIINVNPYNLGKKAMEIMLGRIRGEDMCDKKIFLPVEIEIGESLQISENVSFK